MAAKKVSRATSKKLKDKWRAKQWYSIHAPDMFDNKEIPGTPADEPDKLMNRIVEVTMQELTGDFSKSYIKLKLRIKRIAGFDAYTTFIGHEFTSDYIRRLTRRRRTKIDGVFDVTTKDGFRIRVKPMAIAENRIQTSQKVAIRHQMSEVVHGIAGQQRMAEFVSSMIRGDVSRDIFRVCKPIYRLKRIDIRKSQILGQLSSHRNVEEEPEDIDAIPGDEVIVGEDGEPIDIDAIPEDEVLETEGIDGEEPSEGDAEEEVAPEESAAAEAEAETPEMAPEEVPPAPEVAPEDPEAPAAEPEPEEPVPQPEEAPVAEEPPVEEEAPEAEEAPAPPAPGEAPEAEEVPTEPEPEEVSEPTPAAEEPAPAEEESAPEVVTEESESPSADESPVEPAPEASEEVEKEA